ncbi:hypothetical protein NP233_g10354 [Leucocoprinus birnbaumii]|uniref:Uncharacterized protein n=1 Tax=Leucocoprinus birnbaumii TaxID=56174 RepID=A0AAD5VKY1_9AGAR|nr:hypothetical protein NP233_g10354 [Leucocoprinus birnbaumii]
MALIHTTHRTPSDIDKQFIIRVEDAEAAGSDWDEILRNERNNHRLLPSHLSSILAAMVERNLAAYEPPKQTRSVLLYWRLPEEWADVLHRWAVDTGQLNTILTFYDITDPPIESALSGIPVVLLKKAISILAKNGRAQTISIADGEGVRFFAGNNNLASTSERRRIKCPLCREHWFRKDANKLVFFPVIVDSADASVDHVIDGLNRMDKTCKGVSVRRAHAKLTKAAEDIDEDHAEQLRKAIEDFSQRILPLFDELELGRKRIQELESNQQTKFQDLNAKSRRVEALEREVLHLRRSKAELESNLSESLDSAEAFRMRVEELQGSLADVRGNLSTKEAELTRVQDAINRFKASDSSKTTKIKILRQEVETLGIRLQEKENRIEERNNMMDIDQGHILDGTLAAKSSALTALHRHSDEGWAAVDSNFRFEGLPAPGFKSNGSSGSHPGKNILRKKSRPSCTEANSNFPLSLDRKGRPTTAVQLGPKSTLRVQRI